MVDVKDDGATFKKQTKVKKKGPNHIYRYIYIRSGKRITGDIEIRTFFLVFWFYFFYKFLHLFLRFQDYAKGSLLAPISCACQFYWRLFLSKEWEERNRRIQINVKDFKKIRKK